LAGHYQWRPNRFCKSARSVSYRYTPSDLTSRARQPETWGDVQKVTLDRALVVSKDCTSDPVALDDALQALVLFDPRKAQVIDLRFFGSRTARQRPRCRYRPTRSCATGG
jgi:hypothetical protein